VGIPSSLLGPRSLGFLWSADQQDVRCNKRGLSYRGGKQLDFTSGRLYIYLYKKALEGSRVFYLEKEFDPTPVVV